jgi:hypothetical protein
LLVGELDSLLEFGLGAFNDLDMTTRQLTQAKELAETRSREAQRLQLIDEQSRTSLSVREFCPDGKYTDRNRIKLISLAFLTW